MRRSKKQLYAEMRKYQNMVVEMAKNPTECNNCLELEEVLVLKERRIDTMIHNIQKYMRENGLMKKFLKEIL